MKKINVTRARKLYDQGERVLIIPRKTNPRNMWGIGLELKKSELMALDIGEEFDKICNQYIYYNCNSELGASLAYYIYD
ncbi:MAG: hypothetical protein RR338_03020 [Clostridia bacterium]